MKSSQDLNRRQFLSGSALALAPLGISHLNPGAAGLPFAAPQSRGAVLQRKLGRTGIQLPVVSMGVMNADNPAVVQKSYEIGVRLFDTALGYQGGRNEEMVGSVIKSLGVRDKVIIQTKIPYPRRPTAEESRQKFLSDFEGSLKRLQTDYVDGLFLHQPSVSQMNDPGVIQAMTEAKKQRRARYIGVSTHGSQAEVLSDAAKSMNYDVIIVGFNFTQGNDRALLDAVKNAAAKGIGLVAMKTQASGRRGGGGSVNQTAALKWVLHHQEITTAIPGYTNFEHMEQDFSVAYGLDYTEDEKKFLSEKNLLADVPFCRQCGKCLPTCPKGVDIPTLMRTHMYAACYGNFLQARATLDEIDESAHLRNCGSCSECSARCVNHVNIAGNVRDLRAMYL